MTLRQIQGIVLAAMASVALVLAYAGLGGTSFQTLAIADPCAPQATPDPGGDLDQLAQTLVLMAGRDAACKLGVSREELLLALPSPRDRAAAVQRRGRSEQQLEQALKTGLVGSVDRLAQAGYLPSSSELVDTYKDQLGLPSAAVGLIDSVPDDTIDELVPVPEILRDAAQRLDAAQLLDHLDDEDALQADVTEAIKDATIARARQAIQDQLGVFGGLFG